MTVSLLKAKTANKNKIYFQTKQTMIFRTFNIDWVNNGYCAEEQYLFGLSKYKIKRLKLHYSKQLQLLECDKGGLMAATCQT